MAKVGLVGGRRGVCRECGQILVSAPGLGLSLDIGSFLNARLARMIP